MAENEITEQILDMVSHLGDEIDRCDAFLEKAGGEKAERLKKVRQALSARYHRAESAMNILNGAAFTLKEVDGRLTVVEPSPQTANLVKTAEDHGAVVTEYYSYGEERNGGTQAELL